MKSSAPPPPVYQPPPPDPALAQQAAQADQDRTMALEDKLKGDTASIMARYGALAALAGAGR